jgi:hypothetical protein
MAAKGIKPKPYDIWTKENAEKFFIDALELAKAGEITLTSIAAKLNQNPQIFNYLTSKFINLVAIRKDIELFIENNIVSGAMKNDYPTTFSIFLLKNKYGYTDKTEVENTVKLNTDIIVDGKKITE